MGSIMNKPSQSPSKEPERECFYELEDDSAASYCNSILQILYCYAPLRTAIISWGTWRKKISQLRENDQFLKAAETRLRNTHFQAYNFKRDSKNSNQAYIDAYILDQCCKSEMSKPESNVTASEHCTELKYSQVECLLLALFGLFNDALQKKRVSTGKPTQIVRLLKKKNDLLYSQAGNTASQFLAFLLSYISFMMHITNRVFPTSFSPCSSTDEDSAPDSPFTIIESTFRGEIIYETLCCTCETPKDINDVFLHLPIDIKPHTSVKHSLNRFLRTHYTRRIFCEQCHSLQETKVSPKFDCLPKVMILNLRRCKSKGNVRDDVSISHQLAYSHEIRIPPSETLYTLYAVIAHYSPHFSGDYVSYVRSKEGWIMFDELGVRSATTVTPNFSFLDVYDSVNQRIGKTGVFEEILFYEKSQIDSLTLETS